MIEKSVNIVNQFYSDKEALFDTIDVWNKFFQDTVEPMMESLAKIIKVVAENTREWLKSIQKLLKNLSPKVVDIEYTSTVENNNEVSISVYDSNINNPHTGPPFQKKMEVIVILFCLIILPEMTGLFLNALWADFIWTVIKYILDIPL